MSAAKIDYSNASNEILAPEEHERAIWRHNARHRPQATRRRLFRLARDLTRERDTSARLADRCLDLGRELEALRDAVRAHEAARSIAVTQADRDLWAAAKVKP